MAEAGLFCFAMQSALARWLMCLLVAGARRKTIQVSVLESLRCYLQTFTLATVIAEVRTWLDTGCSCFHRLLTKLHLTPPFTSMLDRVLPEPSG